MTNATLLPVMHLAEILSLDPRLNLLAPFLPGFRCKK